MDYFDRLEKETNHLYEIANEARSTYLEGAAGALAQHAASYILGRAEGNPGFRVEALRREEILRGIQIYKDFPELDVIVFSVHTSKLPDYNMYKKISNMQPEELNAPAVLPEVL